MQDLNENGYLYKEIPPYNLYIFFITIQYSELYIAFPIRPFASFSFKQNIKRTMSSVLKLTLLLQGLWRLRQSTDRFCIFKVLRSHLKRQRKFIRTSKWGVRPQKQVHYLLKELLEPCGSMWLL
jgi:hypothetical protein